MSRQLKQRLAMEARQMANEDSFVSLVILFEKDIEQCSQNEFIEILSNLEQIMEKKSVEQRPIYIEQVYKRILQILSKKISIDENLINKIIKEYSNYFPLKSILTFDDLKEFNLEMERRSLVIHFDLSGSMKVPDFPSLVQNIINLSTKFHSQGIETYFSLFGGKTQETIHNHISNRLLTLNEFIHGNFQPSGGTAFCPSFERTKTLSFPYDAIIISDGEFTDNIAQLTFQDKCQTVFFVAPPWSPRGVEQKHAAAISSCVHSNVTYIGINSIDYSRLYEIIDQYLSEHHSFVSLNQFTSIGNSILPNILLAPTQFIQLFQNQQFQNENILQLFVKKLLNLFRYLEETAKLNFQRCLQSREFQSLMSLLVPLTKLSYAHLETSLAYQQLYGYLSKLLTSFAHEKQKLFEKLNGNDKLKSEMNKFWENAMNFNERSLIIEKNNQQYGSSIAYLNVRVENFDCTIEQLSEALQQIKTIHAPENLDLLSLILDILSSCQLSQHPTHSQEHLNIPIWKTSDGNIDLLSLLRFLPNCLRQYQSFKNVSLLDNEWTFQPLVATRLAWIIDASNRTFPDFITNALPSLVKDNQILTDLNLDENRTSFWMKILRQLSTKINLSQEILQTIEQILTVYSIKGFLLRLTDHSVSYEKQIYENVLPFIDTNHPKAWCIFIDQNGNRLNCSTGQIIESTSLITDPQEIERYYWRNVSMHGSLVRPRYLTLQEYPQLPQGAIELYQTAKKKDTDILREQLNYDQSLSLDQINAHIYTIRNRVKSIPLVLWGSSTEQIVNQTKTACLNATIPTETVFININRSIAIDYLISHCQNRFVAGALRGFVDYTRVSREQSSMGINEIDYAIQSGINTTTDLPTFDTTHFQHLNKSVVKEYFEKLEKDLNRSLQSIRNPPQFQSLSSLYKQFQSNQMSTDQILGMNHLLEIPQKQKEDKPILDQQLFTCPITLDIMDNPAVTTPCGHMFEMEAITSYTNNTSNACPICRTTITNITQSYAFKNVIQAWIAQQKD